MSKKYSIFITALFCGFISLFLVWHILLPDSTFSENENRYLDQLPTLSAGDFKLTLPLEKSGDFFTAQFMKDFESYINDQFPLRDSWVELKARLEVLSGKRSNNSVYFDSTGTLIADYPEPDQAQVDKNLGYVSLLGQKLEVPVWFSLIPGKSEAWQSLLPVGAPVGDQSAVLDQASRTENVTWLPMSLPYSTTCGDRLYLSYYGTDHHWTTAGAYQGYADLMEGMGLAARPLGALSQVSDRFYGTTWSKAGAYWLAPDTMEIAVSDEDVTVTNYFTSEATPGKLYNYEKLEGKDKYTFFLGGNQPLCIIESEKEGAEGSILILRDSFSDALAPFLTQNFAEIHLMDLRYYKGSIANYVQENGIDQVLVLYSVDNFVADTNLFVMGF